eukprot:3043544-Alexandrium_andersonii.AAC.1
MPLAQAELARPAAEAEAERLKASAKPPCHPASPETRPTTRAASGSAGGCSRAPGARQNSPTAPGDPYAVGPAAGVDAVGEELD